MVDVGQLFCSAFIIAFLLLYSAIFLVILVAGLRGMTPMARKQAAPRPTNEPSAALALSQFPPN